MSGDSAESGAQTEYTPEFDSDEEKDKFIRGVMISQVWAYTVEQDVDQAAEFAELFADHDGELGEEYDKLLNGEGHEFGRAVADHFGLPYTHKKGGITLHQPYGKRYSEAWVKLGVEPSMGQKILNAATLGVLGRDE